MLKMGKSTSQYWILMGQVFNRFPQGTRENFDSKTHMKGRSKSSQSYSEEE